MKTNKKSGMTLIELLVLIAIIFIVCGLTLGILGSKGCNNSSGIRTGTITKFSHKGLVKKSWEGELLMGGVANHGEGTVANVWQFSVLDTNLVPKIDKAAQDGSRVSFNYQQTFFYNPMRRDTAYFITGVIVLTNK